MLLQSDDYMFFFKQSKFWKQAGACLWKELVQALSMLTLCLFIKIFLGVCLRKRIDQARNMIILKKLLYKMCCCCDTDHNIICHQVSAINFAVFLTNQKENVLQYLTEKIIISMEKFMLPRKLLNIIVFCKAQHNT